MNEHTPTILIIDDEPITRLTLEGLLASASVSLVFAENGKIGIEKAQSLLPDAILLDVMMPDMDGYEVCRKLRADPQLAEVHIVMITALDDRDARLTGFMAGADDFVSKPFDGMELQLRLKTILRLNRYQQLMADRARFSWLVEHDENGYLLLNPDGIVQYANASAQTLLHLPQDSNGVNFPSHVMQYYTPHPTETWNQWLSDPSPCYLLQTETPSARAFWLLLDALDAPFNNTSSRVVRISDVTENLFMHQDMRKFHSAVTHKMRTPVSLLVSSMSLVETRLDVLTETEIKDFVKVAMKGVNRLASEVKDVLAYIDAPLSLQHGTKLKLNALPASVQASQLQAGIVDLNLNISEELPDYEMTITDYAFGLILDELLENSRKFHPEKVPQIEIVVEPADSENAIYINIKDNGTTLTAEQLIWARRPYHQGEKFFTGEVPGMGLGIPLISTLVWQVGGQIRISNRDDKSGLSVLLKIPIIK